MLTEISATCLVCACENASNDAARALLRQADALSATGVIAAVFIGDSTEREELLGLARASIQTQRHSCTKDGPFAAERCPTEIRDRLA